MGVPLPKSKWRPWAELPERYLSDIIRNLPCILDHARFSGVCTRWRETARTNPPRFPFPWLMMPSTAATSFFCVACRATHHRPRLPADARGARFCGSFPGGWLVAELPWPRGHYALLNLLTGARVPLPRLLAVPCHGGGKMCPVVLHAVTLSAAPSVEPGPGEPYYAAAIVAGQSNIAFWCPRAGNCWFPPIFSSDASDESWHDFLPKNRIEDVIYFSGNGKYFVGFYVLTDKEDLLMFRPEPDGDGAQLSTFTVRYSFPGHCAAEPAPGQTVSRYLVVSRGELLMIVRFAGPEERTRFDVFVLEEKEIIRGADHNGPPRVLASWRRCCSAATLSGRRIFLGRGCSVAVDVGYPFPLYIYFLDDGRRSHGALPTAGYPPYPCSETGGFWFFNKGIVRSLPREPPSDCSPWIWFFLSDATFRAGVPPPASLACGWGVDTDSE
ncbi:unnamed protein product [Triticum turgidum subsp. durum]|uniref:KIB1-4 beta-propeller domain-containing protein n=1 Tax=Triticum turgidum subsp. durum TaxID=4567 RepID=A0A9R0YJL0_TRITD|nr:unnamed protein product [Triticum turgidum subsp. durum]